jgi:hypothetical protein
VCRVVRSLALHSTSLCKQGEHPPSSLSYRTPRTLVEDISVAPNRHRLIHYREQHASRVLTLLQSQTCIVRDKEGSSFLTAFKSSSECSALSCLTRASLCTSEPVLLGGIVMLESGTMAWRRWQETPDNSTSWTDFHHGVRTRPNLNILHVATHPWYFRPS